MTHEPWAAKMPVRPEGARTVSSAVAGDLSVDSPQMAQDIIICFAASCSFKDSSEMVMPIQRRSQAAAQTVNDSTKMLGSPSASTPR
jgi:hypothetical protein